MEGPPLRLLVDALHARLREELEALADRRVGEVTRTFLEVTGVAVARGLWSLEFAFDEDDGRVARLEALFGNGLVAERTGAHLRGYEVRVLLPKELPKYSIEGHPSECRLERPPDPSSLVARFVRSLEDLGAYRLIEPLVAVELETVLL